MYLLDTVAISETSKKNPHPGIVLFLDSVSGREMFISVVTLAELHFGWTRLPEGKRRQTIQLWTDEIENTFEGRTLPVVPAVAKLWGRGRAEMHGGGNNIGMQDLLIAATALHHDLTVVTRNVKDFTPTGCKILNPWDTELE